MNDLPDQSKKRKGYAALLIVICTAFVVQFVIFKKPSFDKVMIKTAAELNKTCPAMADKDTRLDSAEVLPERTFKYHYTLVHFNKDSVDLELYQLSIQPAILNNARHNPNLELFRKNKVTFVYDFRDSKGAPVTSIVVTPEMYRKD